MRFVYPGLRDPGQDVDPRREAASAFFDLGDKLRSWYQRNSNHEQGMAEAFAEGEGPAALLGTIEGEIIPRLLLAHSDPCRTGEADSRDSTLTPEDRFEFLRMVMTESAVSTRRYIEALLVRGVSQDAIFLDLLTHTARRLGELWEEDRCDFAEVTIGLCRLHQVVREMSLYEDGTRPDSDAPRVLLASACGDQHVFGVVMVAEFFRRAGWRVWSEPGASSDQLAAILARDSFDVLGISVACSMFAEDVAAEIGALRKASCNTKLKVLVGGRLIAERPDLLDAIGADGSACDAGAAPSVGNELLARR